MSVQRYANTITALIDALPELLADAMPPEQLQAAIANGAFRPAEDTAIGYWFSRLLTMREDLHDVLADVDDEVQVAMEDINTIKEWRCFVIGFAAACVLVRIDRFLVSEFANHTLIQRKLNEAFPEYRIERKRYSAIYSAYTDANTMMRLFDAVKLARKNQKTITSLCDDPIVGGVAQRLPQLQSILNTSKRYYLRRALKFLQHKWRRRGASARHKTLFVAFEAGGRLAAKLNPGKKKKVTPQVLSQVAAELQPGDIMITRHRYALTNYFLPGTWPHASLYIGTEQQREEWGIKVSPPIAHRWKKDKCTLEALRDGVLFRPLAETLRVDAYVIVRPNLSRAAIAEGIARIVLHEGKMYNFDFDFFSSDRLVCTEVIYRAFDGLENLSIPLTERAGRKTLTAEDILDMALDTDMFTLQSVFGFPDHIDTPLHGESVRQIVADSFRT